MSEKNRIKADPISSGKWLDRAPWIAIVFAVLLFVLYVTPIHYPIQKRSEAWGQLGDFMGGLLNPLISLFTLFVAVAVWRLQKKELKETNVAFIKQTTQQTFFNLLQQQRELVNAVVLMNDSSQAHTTGLMAEKYTGRSAFSAVVSALNHTNSSEVPAEVIREWTDDYQFTCADTTSFRPQLMFASWYLGEACGFADCEGKPFLLALEMSFGHVFRSIFQILKFAANAPGLTAEEKRDLVNYLRAQMSEDEFVLYALSSLTKIGEKSRAVSITVDFFENRMQTMKWARPMLHLLSSTESNLIFAKSQGFSSLENPC